MSFIEFYKEHNISPVRQDISDLKQHFRRRDDLYRHLGLLPSCFEKKKILEIGPGSGHNSIHIASLRPSSYHLVEGNMAGVKDMESLFEHFKEYTENMSVFPMLIEKFAERYDSVYDIVLCEGMLPGLPRPINTLKLIARFVKPGGVLVITCVDPCSQLFESLRHLIGHILTRDCESIEDKIERLMPVFSSHLDTLKDMTRNNKDWIIDNIINPAAIGPTLSIAEAIESIGEEFDLYGTSPRIFSDWRWYKSIHADPHGFNSSAIEQYWSIVHNFLDYKSIFKPRAQGDNRELYRLCEDLRKHINAFVKGNNIASIKKINILLKDISLHVKSFSMKLYEGVENVIQILNEFHVASGSNIKSERYRGIFGRGQQYVSFTRKKN